MQVIGQSKTFNSAIRQVILILLAGAAIGLCVSLIATFFVRGVRFFSELRQGSAEPIWLGGEVLFSMAPLVWLIGAALVLAYLRRLLKVSRWHGPADTIYAAHRSENQIDIRSGFASTTAAFVSLAGGAPVGQYGPLVHFGATIASYLQKVTKNRVIGVDVFIGCGVAAAISAGFHAPIAGIVFAHEAVLRHFSFRAMTPIAIASITSEWFSTSIFGGEPIFSITASAPDLLPMIIPLLASGLVFGIIGLSFMKMLLFTSSVAAKSCWPPIKLMLTASVVIGGVASFVPAISGAGVGEINAIISDQYGIAFLLLILVLKLCLTSLSIGFGLFGGVFSPAVFIGAAAGGAFGKVLEGFGLLAVPHLFPIAGFAAVTAAVVGAPISVVIIVLELTQSYEFAVAAMLAAVVSTLLTSLVFGHSLFDAQLALRGVDISKGRVNLDLMASNITSIATTSFVRLTPDLTVKQTIEKLVKAGAGEGYCIDADDTFRGKVSLQDLLPVAHRTRLNDCMDQDPLLINHDASVLQAIEVASEFVGETIPVVDQKQQRLIGVVSEADIFAAYLAVQHRIRDLEHS
jgi:CIC family chloride channel protein